MYPHLECRVHAPSALCSRQHHAACPCHSQVPFLQAAAAARIADGSDIFSAAEDGDVERVRDHLLADPASVHVTNDSCAIFHTDPFEKKGGISVCFELCNARLLFRAENALHLSSENGHLEVCRLLVECRADVNAMNECTILTDAHRVRQDTLYVVILHTYAFEYEGGDRGFVMNFVTLVFFSVENLHCICLLKMVTSKFASSWSSVMLT